MLNYLYDMPENVKRELSNNFCAMKYIHSLSDKKRNKIIKKAEKMNELQLKSYIIELGNKFF